MIGGWHGRGGREDSLAALLATHTQAVARGRQESAEGENVAMHEFILFVPGNG